MTARKFFRSRAWRALRWAGLAAAVPALWACNARSLEAPMVKPNSTFQNNFQETVNRQIDLLFMIDDSSSMETAQANLKANMGNFMDVLKGLQGGLPDLHVAIVTSDMGAGDGSSIMGCSVSGDNGVFRYQPTGTCTNVGFTDPNATFLVDSGGTGTPTTNFGTQDITAVFQCISTVGATGCGFEHQLASVARALGADGMGGPPPQNAGFLRPDAYLGIVLVTNEDDCSGPPGDPLFDPTSSQLASTYGPTENFQCNEFGHLCLVPAGLPNAGTMQPPSRMAPNNLATDTVTYTGPMAATSNCVSNEQSTVLTSVGSVADGIKQLKTDPANQILVAALTGLNEGASSNGYKVTWQTAPTPDTGPWPKIQHACGSDAAGAPQGFADPGVRIEQFVGEFGANGLVDNFCQANYGPSLTTIATKLSQLIGPKCIVGTVADKPGTTNPDCTVTELAPNMSDPLHPIPTVIPMCDAGHTNAPCWTIGPPPAGMGGQCTGQVITIDDGGTMPPQNTKSAVNCSLCTPNFPDPMRNCP
jgi:hypothetical protein